VSKLPETIGLTKTGSNIKSGVVVQPSCQGWNS